MPRQLVQLAGQLGIALEGILADSAFLVLAFLLKAGRNKGIIQNGDDVFAFQRLSDKGDIFPIVASGDVGLAFDNIILRNVSGSAFRAERCRLDDVFRQLNEVDFHACGLTGLGGKSLRLHKNAVNLNVGDLRDN